MRCTDGLTDSDTCFHVVTIIKTNKRKVATMTAEQRYNK